MFPVLTPVLRIRHLHGPASANSTPQRVGDPQLALLFEIVHCERRLGHAVPQVLTQPASQQSEGHDCLATAPGLGRPPQTLLSDGLPQRKDRKQNKNPHALENEGLLSLLR